MRRYADTACAELRKKEGATFGSCQTLHTFAPQKPTRVGEILGHGVMVTLQILVLSFQVRVLVSQQEVCGMRTSFRMRCVVICSIRNVPAPKIGTGTFAIPIKIGGYSSSACLSMAFIFSFTNLTSSLRRSTLRFISSTRLLPFLLLAFRKPRLFSYVITSCLICS